MAKRLKILLIGPVTNVNAGLIGGATISFGFLINYLKDSNELYRVINTQRFPKGIKRIINPIYVLLKVVLAAPFCNVIFLNSSRGGTKYLVPILYIISKVFRLKFVFRPFGGDIKDYTSRYSNFQQWVFRNTVLKADVLFLQTKELMHYYANENANVFQLLTSREKNAPELLRGERPYSKRFIFLGFINQAKGIDHILEAAEELGEDYTVHVYGPIKEQRYNNIATNHPAIYQGVLEQQKVLSTLRKYDVLILPTYYEGEGYPGAIIEAYSLGLPVISTNWKAIPEIIKRCETGLVIEIKSTAQLVAAMQYFEVENYSKYSQDSLEYFNANFETKQVTGEAIQVIKKLF